MAIPGELIPLMAIAVGGIAVIGRVVVQPVVAAVLKLSEQRRGAPTVDVTRLEQRLEALDERFARLERSVDRLIEDRDFYLQLQAGRPKEDPPRLP